MIPAAREPRWLLRALLLIVVAGLSLALVSDAATLVRRLDAGAAEQRGEQAFYDHPATVRSAAPGTLVRSEELASAPDGMRGWRVLYYSTDRAGADILVSGIIAAPDAAAPPGGRTVVAWGHPTTGTAARCAPSSGIDPFDVIEGLRDLVHAGYVVAASDYSGMGSAGPASFLIGTTEGHNVLDSARAARQLAAAGASDRLALWGHSQGGHAALFAAELAAPYAPELRLQAVAVAAPATELGGLLNADIGDVSGVTIGAYAFDAYSSAYAASEPGLRLDAILTPAGVAALPEMAALCLLGQNSALHVIARPLIGGFLAHDPTTTEPWASLLAENTPGAAAIPVPLFVAQGASDTLVRPALTAEFVEEQRALGADVESHVIPDTGHALVALRAMPALMRWLAQHAAPSDMR
ncbi:lipase family protein [Microterricola viridarii]|uniref:Lipase n=1 Tax=Microterricola viridarii TaxID=412690 RepID=A0A0X8E312_9MICO|nr:lipase family protein [Microterricola viridarii]AMB59153.1 lipase [Microterricola viridarii]